MHFLLKSNIKRHKVYQRFVFGRTITINNKKYRLLLKCGKHFDKRLECSHTDYIDIVSVDTK